MTKDKLFKSVNFVSTHFFCILLEMNNSKFEK